MNQLDAAYARGKEAKELAVILGEAALSPDDKLFAKFADHFEDEYIRQGENEDRPIEYTLNLGWDLLSMLPDELLTRVRESFIQKYMPAKRRSGE